MDESDEYMDTSLSPVRAATGGQKFEEKYDPEGSGYGRMDDSMGSPVHAVGAGAASIGGSMYTSAMAMVENDEEEEDIVIGDGGSREDQRWDSIVGVLESILMDDSFSDAQEEYCVQHCHHFDDSDENKLVYTSIYKNYTDMIESRIESELTMAIEGFTMAELSSMLEEREGEICGDIWDMLMTIGDFAEFKNLMLAYKVQAQQQAGMRQQQVTASSSFLDAAVSTSQASFEGLAPLVTNLSSNGHL